MTVRLAVLTAALAAAVLLLPGPAARAADEPSTANGPIRAVVVTGGHGFQKEPFLEVFKGHDGLTATHVHLQDHSELFEDTTEWPYDVIVLYNMTQKISETRRQNFLALLNKGVGLVALHHSLAAWQEWPAFAQIIGGRFFTTPDTVAGTKYEKSGWKHGLDYTVHVQDPSHPITRGMKDFTIHDETYCRYWVSPKAHVLLTTDEKTSDKVIGWTCPHPKTRVAYIINGHDAKAYANPNYRTLVTRAIRWAAGKRH